MSSGTHAQHIVSLLAASSGLDDDEIARRLAITPRQTVNQICRRLARENVLVRERGPSGKIVNRLQGDDAIPAAPDRATPRVRWRGEASRLADAHGRSLCPTELAKALILVPCSKTKQVGSPEAGGRGLLTDSLPESLADELVQARHKIAANVLFDETAPVPAMERYSGTLYQDGGRAALRDLMRAGTHVIILSGGYGAVLANEPIGVYEAALRLSWWPGNVLERVLVAYARVHDIQSVRAFAAATSPYAKVLTRARWREAGIADALLVTPEARPGGVRMSPASIGQALSALRNGTLTVAWRSSYGLGVDVREI